MSIPERVPQKEKWDQQARELEDREYLFQSIPDQFPDAVVIVSSDGRILYVNNRTEKMFGYTRYELLGYPIEILVPERFREVHVRIVHVTIPNPAYGQWVSALRSPADVRMEASCKLRSA